MKIADQVESYADQMAALSDEELQAKTPEFRSRIEKGESLDDLLPEALPYPEKLPRVLGQAPSTCRSSAGLPCTG